LSNDKVTLHFQGKPVSCRPDTSVAVALWENGIRVLSHSPKYGRPRGLTCARGQCTSCLMRVDGVPNIRTCETVVRPGMTVEIQDTGTFYGPVMQKTLATADNLFPVGFYYKWFTKPAVLSRFFLDRIRPLTGVGKITTPEAREMPAEGAAGEPAAGALAQDLGSFKKVIVGAGPAGLTAALHADEAVLVVDDHDECGGQRYAALKEAVESLGNRQERFPVLVDAWRRLEGLNREFGEASDRTFLGGVKVVAGYHPCGLLLRRGDELATVEFDELTWAGGAMDTLGLFPGNDTPGLIGPRALYRLLMRDGLDVAGKQVLVIGHGLDFWLSVTLLAARGALLALVITEPNEQTEVSAAVDAKWQLTTGLQLASVRSVSNGQLSATLVPRESSPGPLHTHVQMDADLAVICGQGKPTFDIPYQVGVDMTLQTELGGFVPSGAGAQGYSAPLPGGATVSVVGEALGNLPGQNVPAPEEDPVP
jgi:2Fe-2S iron-sulfur cluster protein